MSEQVQAEQTTNTCQEAGKREASTSKARLEAYGTGRGCRKIGDRNVIRCRAA